MQESRTWTYKTWDEVTKEELYAFTKLRIAVFVIEQNCPYPEYDDKDQKSWHVWTEHDGKVIAYVRIVRPGVSYKDISIGRVVVDEDWRSTGLGVELMNKSMDFVKRELGSQPIRISAQEYLKNWYSKLGFVQVSEVYLEDDIPHMEMLYTPKNEDN